MGKMKSEYQNQVNSKKKPLTGKKHRNFEAEVQTLSAG